MKTPRELLLERHRSMDPKLDAIREHVVAGLRPTARGPAPTATGSLWEKLVMPLRWHLAGLAIVWMVIALLNTEQRAEGETATASSTQELLVAMQENRRQLLELTEASLGEPDRPKPALQPFVPKRRSEAVPSFAVA